MRGSLHCPECSDWTDEESPNDGAPPSDQVQRGAAVTLALHRFGKKSAATPLWATGIWQSLTMPKITSKSGRRGEATEIEV